MDSRKTLTNALAAPRTTRWDSSEVSKSSEPCDRSEELRRHNPRQDSLGELAEVVFQVGLTLEIFRQVLIDQYDIPVNHPGQPLEAQGKADDDDQEREDRPHVLPQAGIGRQEEITQEDGDQERAQDGLEPLEQVQPRRHDDQHKGQATKAAEIAGAAQDWCGGGYFVLSVDRPRGGR